jgi:eukaryotic-like serine/threonine-protein kinase
VRLGRYELIAKIGSGGMAEVHLAAQRGPGGFERLVVIKLLVDSRASGPPIGSHLAARRDLVEMLLEEGRLAGMIDHPNVVDIYDLGEVDGRYFIAMEYLDGEPLLALLRAGADGHRLDALSTARLISDVAEGLEAAHRLKSREGKPLGLVHHDVSPGNIIVLYSGIAKLVDFGVAKARTARQDRIQGKLGYMAPEKLTEGAEIDRRSDIWSLGVVAWEALTLTRLFGSAGDADTLQQVRTMAIVPPSQVNGDVPAELDPVVMRALERDPLRRHATAKAFALELEDVLRKAGYGDKHERIARYMEQTFASQISARDRLLAGLRRGGEATPEALAMFKAFKEAATETVSLDGLVPTTESAVASAPEAPAPEASATHSRRWVALAGGLLLVIVIALIASRGGSGRTREPAIPDAGPSTPREPIATSDGAIPAVDATLAELPDAGVADVEAPAGDADGDADAIDLPPETISPRPRPRAKPGPQALYTRGLEAYRRRDLDTAGRLFGEATRQFPSYAPGWYGKGMVLEAQNQRGAARAAYLRYLSLAPRAANADALRAHLARM